MSLENISAGVAVEPFTLAEAKAHLIVAADDTSDDDLITTQMIAARTIAETYINRPIATQTWRRTLDCLPDQICLPKVDVLNLSRFDYTDTDGNPQSIAPAAYALRNDTAHAALVPAYGTRWPTVGQGYDVVVIEWDAGFAAGVPADIQAAIKLILGELYLHREETVEGVSLNTVPRSSQALLAPHVVYSN